MGKHYAESAPMSQQFSLWPLRSAPGEGTRPTPLTEPTSCRPGALTRRPHLVHNENCCQCQSVACPREAFRLICASYGTKRIATTATAALHRTGSARMEIGR